MSRVAIVTNSTADMTPEMAATAGVRVVPALRPVRRRGVPGRHRPFHGAVLGPDAGARRAVPDHGRPLAGHVPRDLRGVLRRGRRGDRLPHDRDEALGHLPERHPGRPGPAGPRDPRHRHGVDLDVDRDPGPDGGRDGGGRHPGRGDRDVDPGAPAGRRPLRRRRHPGLPAQGRSPLPGAGSDRHGAVGEADHHRDRRDRRDGGEAANTSQGPRARDRADRRGSDRAARDPAHADQPARGGRGVSRPAPGPDPRRGRARPSSRSA